MLLHIYNRIVQLCLIINLKHCRVWQHVVCMGLDKNNIPDEYLCELCKPRPIDRKRAKAMQARRRNEIRELNNSSSSDGEPDKRGRGHPKKPQRPNTTTSTSSNPKEGKIIF